MADYTAESGYQKHPSTFSAHWFEAGSKVSICKREQRSTAPVVSDPGIFPCGHCKKALARISNGGSTDGE